MLLHTVLGLTLTVVVGFGAAQGTTVSLFLPNTDPQSLVASVIGTDATATTYLISCPSGTDSSNCGYGGGATVVEGPTTLQVMIGGASIACDLAGTTQAVCTQSQTLSGYSTTELVTSTLGPADITYFPVGVTAGAEKLGPASTTSVSASPTSTTGGGGTGSTMSTGIVGSISVAVTSNSASGPAASTSTTGMVSNSSASMSLSSSEVSSIRSQTQTASAATASASSGALRIGQIESRFLAGVMGCWLAGALAVRLV